MKTLDSVGINCFCWLHRKSVSRENLSLFFCSFRLCSVCVSAL